MHLKNLNIKQYFFGRKLPRYPNQKTWKEQLHSKVFETPPPIIQDVIPLLFLFGLLVSLIAVFLPLHPNFLMIFGLGIDIIGAFLIVSPIINEYSRFTLKEFKIKYSYPKISKSHPDDDISILNNQNRGRLGLSVLILGFLFQILGNVLQWANSL